MSSHVDANSIIRQNSLDDLIKVFELGSGLSDVPEILKISGNLVTAFPVVGALFLIIDFSRPGYLKEEILERFNQLSTQFDRVRDDIKDLGEDLGWHQTEQHYRDAVNQIEVGMMYCFEIGRAVGWNSTQMAKNRLKSLCANETCTLNLKNLMKGITGKGLLTDTSILEMFDAAEAKGRRKTISPLATRLLQVAIGGFLVISTYEMTTRGIDDAEKFIEQQDYRSHLEDACLKVQSVLDRRVDKFRENMVNDLNTFLDTGRADQDLCTEISDFMNDKYDWLENFVLIYNDSVGYDKYPVGYNKHHVAGYHVRSVHPNGTCGVVFYRTKGETAIISDRSYKFFLNYTLHHIPTEFFIGRIGWIPYNALERYHYAINVINKQGIEWIGVAVIKSGSNLHMGGTFLNKTVGSDIKGDFAVIILLK